MVAAGRCRIWQRFLANASQTEQPETDWDLGGAVGCGVITHDAGSGQEGRYCDCVLDVLDLWPTPKATAKVVVVLAIQ